MAKVTVSGLEEYANRLSGLYADCEEITKKAVYAGAEVVADEIKKGLKNLPIDNRHGTPEKPLKGVTKQQKSDLINAFGLAPIENRDGYIQTKAGVDGYGSTTSKKYPKGLPNALLMRSVESGTSFRVKTPVFRKAVNTSRKRSIEAMGKKIDEECQNSMK